MTSPEPTGDLAETAAAALFGPEAGPLDGRRVVITGAAGGLGPVAARAARDAGATVVLVDVSPEKVASVAAALGDGVDDAAAVDLLDDEATAAYARSLVDRVGGIDAVWHLVGGWKGGPAIEDQPLADWQLLHDLAVRTTLHVVRAFTPPLLASSAGRFVLVSSPVAQRPTSSNAAYASMKAAAEAMVLALADRFAGTHATANVVVVTAILTPAMREADPDKPRPSFVAAEDLAAALVYASGDGARNMNGQRLRLTPSGS
jgi:NAD(P)-dependent dehydrogenase (short-subunit alcohol dehydrogenase family)